MLWAQSPVRTHTQAAGSIPGQSVYGWQPIDVSLTSMFSLSLSLSLSLINKNISLVEGFEKEREKERGREREESLFLGKRLIAKS